MHDIPQSMMAAGPGYGHLLTVRRYVERNAVPRCGEKGRPFGDEKWAERTAGRLGITLRGPGRPRRDS